MCPKVFYTLHKDSKVNLMKLTGPLCQATARFKE